MSLKNSLRRAISKSSQNSGLYRLFWHPLIRLSALALREQRWRRFAGNGISNEVVQGLSPDSTVIAGPFAGLRYPSAEAAGSAYWPKILGTYEAELHPVIESIAHAAPVEVIDIGCAEGYYAVGLARLFPGAHISAYDTDDRARALCSALSRTNGVEDRVTVAGTFVPEMFGQLKPNVRHLVIADCEGYEAALFTPETCQALANATLIIEVHDFLVPGLAERLYAIVSRTHEVRRIASIPDFARPNVYKAVGLAHLNHDQQIQLMAELRPMEMEWFVCLPRV